MALFRGYVADGFFDEMFVGSEQARPEYSRVFARLRRLRPDRFGAKSALAAQEYLTHGITFSHDGAERAFPFDLLPRLIRRDEWSAVEAGLRQRVRALDAFLADVYAGPRRAIAEGVIPNSRVVTSSGYLREAVGIIPPLGRFVHIAGIDLVRDGDGVWRVLEDNLRNPSGLSYVLQNRVFMRRVFPEVFTDHQVAPVGHGPMLLRQALAESSPHGRNRANIVVLTPGPANSAYYEHAFLAQQLGVPLVEGSDLVVRDRRLFMKTTVGREPVNVIYRRIDDAFLDPACLRTDSLLGVTGLTQVYRDGNVAICNAMGNGVADDKATYAYVPDLIRFFLDEEPLLDQVPTYLLERDEDREYVLDNLERLVVKAVDGSGGYGILIGPPRERRRAGRDGPTGARKPGRVHRPGHDHAVAGAGLHRRRVPPAARRPAPVRDLRRGHQRDPRRPHPRRAEGGFAGREFLPGGRQQGHLGHLLMLARIAETLFFAARDLERVETTARLLEVTHAMDLEEGYDAARGDWWALVRTVSNFDAFTAGYGVADGGTVGWYLTLSDENPDSVESVLRRARESARSVRHRLPTETWEALNALHLEIAGWNSGRLQREGIYAFCQRVRQGMYRVLGAIDLGMRRDDHWTFLRLGRFLERTRLSSRLLAVYGADLQPVDPEVSAPLTLQRWRSLLHAAQAEEAFAANTATISAESVMRFLALDDRFPRSLIYCLGVVQQCQLSLIDDLAMRPDSRSLVITHEALDFLGAARGALLVADPEYYFEQTQEFCDRITDAVHASCFAAGYARPGGDHHLQAHGQAQN